MKNTVAKIIGISGLLALAASPALAATTSLTNGGFGQVASNPQQFGVAVCSSNALSQNVPISITASGKTVTINSAPSISAGACTYSYVSYSALSMQAGGTYDVDVVIDPQHTVSSNSNNEAIYNIVVPGVAAPTVSANAHAKYDGEYQLSVL